MKKRKDGRYLKVVKINGKREWIYGYSKEEVDEKIQEFKRIEKQGLEIKNTAILWDVANDWYNTKIRNHARLSTSTKEMYMCTLNNHVLPLGHIPIRDITTSIIENYINTLDRSASLLNKIKITYSQIFEYAISEKIILYNHIKGIKTQKNKSRNENFLIKLKDYIY